MNGPVGLGGESRLSAAHDRSHDRAQDQRSPWRFRNWRVRAKIVAILLIPLLAVVALSGVRLSQVLGDMRDSARAEQVAAMAEKATALAHELQAERDLSGAYLGGKRGFGGDELRTQRGNVDKAVRDYNEAERSLDGDVGQVTSDMLGTLRKDIKEIGGVREAVDKGVAPWSVIFDDYSTLISDLLKLEEDIPQGTADTQLGDDVRALSSLSRTKALLSSERGYLAYVFGVGKFDDAQFRQFLNLDARWQAAQEEFEASITDAERTRYQRQVSDETSTAVRRLKEQALVDPTSPSLSIDVSNWYEKASTMLQGMRVAELELAAQVRDRAGALHDDARRRAAMDAGVVLGVLVLTLVLALTVARSLVRPLRQLQAAATEVAFRLPDTVQRLRSTARSDLDAEVEPVTVRSSDEVGEVASAFNSVHREAVRVAVEQALLRKNVSTIFVNLSRRTQSLVERQLRLIDDLEVNEEDNDSLGNLFQLDHLATRMRRNAENLLVLAGADSGRRWSQPVVLLDVLRAATAEVEQYPRVAQTYVTTRKIDGRAVGDVVHLIAELLENALEFSSPETQVVVSARSLHGDAGVMIEIEDHGIGMSADELAMANERLATSAEFDVSLSRMMGLYVVGKLSARHDIRVQLRHSGSGGVTAQIHLPSTIVVQGEPDEDPFAIPAAEYVGASVAAAPQESVGLADLGDHETRPIIADRTRARTWPRGVLEDEYATAAPATRGVDGSGPHERPPGTGGGDDAGSTTGSYLNPFDDFERAFERADPAGGTPAAPPAAKGPNDTLPGVERPTDLPPPEPQAPPPPAQPEPELPEFQSIAEALGPPRQAEAPPQFDQGGTGGLESDETGQFDGSPFDTAAYDASGPDLPTQTVPAPDFTRPTLPRREPRRVDYESTFDGGEPAAAEESVPPPPSPSPEHQQPAGVFGAGESPQPEEPGTGARPAPSSLDADVPVPEEAQDEFLPIYAQVESEWFRRRSRPANATAQNQPTNLPTWESVADEGWRAAEQLAKPRVSGTTKAGLPIRVPMAHYVPGSAGPGGPNGPGKPATFGLAGLGARPGGPNASRPAGEARAQGPQQDAGAEAAGGQDPGRPAEGRVGGQPAGVRSPEEVRGLLSSYHRGLRQGREAGKNRTAHGDEFRTE
jgi:signal transduction histidine kinase